MPDDKRRDYHHGAGRKTKQYPVNISPHEYDLLEDLRAKVSKSKGGRKVSRGELLMWMYYRSYTELDENIPLDDFCDAQMTKIKGLIDNLDGIYSEIKRFKEDAMKVELEEESDESEE